MLRFIKTWGKKTESKNSKRSYEIEEKHYHTIRQRSRAKNQVKTKFEN